MISFFKKLRNWLVFGRFISVYIVVYKCNNIINTIIIESENEQEAIKKVYEEGGKMNCETFKIINIIEY